MFISYIINRNIFISVILLIQMSSSNSSVHFLCYLVTECPNDEARDVCNGPKEPYTYGFWIFAFIVIIIGFVVVLYIIRKKRSFQNSTENRITRQNTLKGFSQKGIFT